MSFPFSSPFSFFPPLFLLFLLLLITAASVSAKTANPSPQNESLAGTKAPLLRFEPFHASEPYRCGMFAEQTNQVDPAMRVLQRTQNAMIRALSRPFPHEKLLSDDALLGNIEAWKQSFVERRDQWTEFEFWWLIGAFLLVSVPPLFTLLYLIYRCISCCCCGAKRSEKALLTDRRFDGVRRLVLNALLGLLIVANIFCAAILLINTQYAQHGLDELPTRLHYCASDVFIYRAETAERIRKLLRDDFSVLNGSLNRALDGTGEAVVERLQKATGARMISEVIDKANNAGPMRKHFDELSRELPRVLDARHALQMRLLRLRQARDKLRECERTAKDGTRVVLCHQAKQALVPMLRLTGAEWEDKTTADWENGERMREMSELLPEQVPPALRDIEQLDLEAKFAPASEGMLLLQRGVQQVVDTHRSDANDRLHSLDRTLNALHDQLSATIKGIDLRFLDEQIVDPIMLHREHFRRIVHFGWIGALVVSGLFAFLALALLLGLCYGCCGRQPNEYDDDCCVRSTGASFFSCSIWLSLAFITVFGLLSAFAMFVGANAAHLVCRPLEEPMQRQDFLSLLDRFVHLYGLDRPSSVAPHKPSSVSDHFSLDQLFTAQRRPADLIRECAQQQTLYTMLGLDKKFKLVGREGLQDDYQYLQRSIMDNLSSQQLIDEALSRGIVPDDPRLSTRQWHFFSGPMRDALQRLGQVHVPEWNTSGVEQFCAQSKHFALEGVIAGLRQLSQSADSEANTGVDDGAEKFTTVAVASNFSELDNVIQFLEELRPDTVQVRTQLEHACAQLEQLQREVNALRFNASLLLDHLQRAETELSTKDRLRAQLQTVAKEVADELLERVRIYERHVNQSMTTEVSSCAPLASIASNTRLALCDYALDPLNSLWVAMAIGLALLLPIILLATALNPLYQHTHPYLKYPLLHTGNSSPSHDAFATDIYAMVGSQQHQQQYHLLPTQQQHTHHRGAKQYTTQQQQQQQQQQQFTSPYATSNYGYHELTHPPAYSMSLISGGDQRR